MAPPSYRRHRFPYIGCGQTRLVDTALWYTKMARKDYTVGAVPIENGVDDPDQMFYEN